jgi:hypothetical protein
MKNWSPQSCIGSLLLSIEAEHVSFKKNNQIASNASRRNRKREIRDKPFRTYVFAKSAQQEEIERSKKAEHEEREGDKPAAELCASPTRPLAQETPPRYARLLLLPHQRLDRGCGAMQRHACGVAQRGWRDGARQEGARD